MDERQLAIEYHRVATLLLESYAGNEETENNDGE
jgi:hypothetical protein